MLLLASKDAISSADGYNAISIPEPDQIRRENAEMATLVLDKVPDELLRQLMQLAVPERLSVAENTVRLLQEAVQQKAQANGSGVQETLERLIRNRFRPDPAGPDVVEMLARTAIDDRPYCLRGRCQRGGQGSLARTVDNQATALFALLIPGQAASTSPL